METRFLLGPAGSGKSWRCLEEIRAELRRAPDGPPLLLLAPKQATFQIERQLLADGLLAGYTRLQILAFDRLASFILGELVGGAGDLLGEEGRVMALRALLARKQPELKLFRTTARLPGFAQELSGLLREFQRHHVSPNALLNLGDTVQSPPQLHDKLHDLALLLRHYLDWLKAHNLRDADSLIDLAIAALRATTPHSSLSTPHFRLSGLWLDGFAEMTAQEIDLLAAVIPFTGRATLAFCLDAEPRADLPWLSPWNIVAQTFRRCHLRIAALEGNRVSVEVLSRDAATTRFAANAPLHHLEAHWPGTNVVAKAPQPVCVPPGAPARTISSAGGGACATTQFLRLVTCANSEAEAVAAAREILGHVRGGGRYRECAVLLRSLDGHHDAVRRVFRRYGIPCFLDRREPVAHHPLAELTRFALRTVAFHWRLDDWFGALKTGLAPADEVDIDRLENEALARGWQGAAWLGPLPLPDQPDLAAWAEKLRAQLVRPFAALAARVNRPLSGAQLAAAIREFWADLEVARQLEAWSAAPVAPDTARLPAAVHETVWEQMQAWLDELALAFPDTDEPLDLRAWLPILEAGLGGLTVGVIPPALDQVLIGALDRSRNPELQLAIVPGLNDGVFPAPAPRGGLLADDDRTALEREGLWLGPTARERLGHERYFAYIAFTRSRHRLVLTCAARDANDRPLSPSPFFDQVREMFPDVEVESFDGQPDWRGAEHPVEIIAPILRAATPNPPLTPPRKGEAVGKFEHSIPSRDSFPSWEGSGVGLSGGTVTDSLASLATLPPLAPALARWQRARAAAQVTRLTPGIAARLFGNELKTSVSGLEDFAACPFKFFTARALRAQERKQFVLDARDHGLFQHEVLREFHRRVSAFGRRWRDVPPAEARALIAEIGEELLRTYDGGRFQLTQAGRFAGAQFITSLQRLVDTLLGWMPQYGFDPAAVEVGFGLDDAGLPACRVDLGDGRALILRGRIDRIDLCPVGGDEALAVVIDYKSSLRKLDPVKLHHGLDLQLLSYLNVLERSAELPRVLGVARVQPVGVFYVSLGAGGAAESRAEATADPAEARRAAHQHFGRFLADELARLDNRSVNKGDQFRYTKNQNGSLSKRGNDALPAAEFHALKEQVAGHLVQFGREIFAGGAEVAPFRKGQETACERCDFLPVCRFDPWMQAFRALRPPPKPDDADGAASADRPRRKKK